MPATAPAACSSSSAAGGCASSRAGRCRPAPSSTSARGSTAGGERGLLGLAFHPELRDQRLPLRLLHPRPAATSWSRRLTANAARTAREPVRPSHRCSTSSTAQNTNHNGGALAFGPDGYLYIAVGDGGGANDPRNNGQDQQQRSSARSCGSTSTAPASGPHDHYAIPVDNPFVGKAGADQIWAWGHAQPVAHQRSTVRTGTSSSATSARTATRSQPRVDADRRRQQLRLGRHGGQALPRRRAARPPANDVLPVAEYTHSLGLLDHGRLRLPRLAPRPAGPLRVRRLLQRPDLDDANAGSAITVRRDTSLNISSFGESESGELYLTDLNGALYRVIAPEFSGHRDLHVPRQHPLALLRGHHGRLRWRQVLPDGRRSPGSRWRSSSSAPSITRRPPPTTSPTMKVDPARARSTRCGRPASRAAAAAPRCSARRAGSPAPRWRSSSTRS